ncbi:MAG TPA: AraC family transcriptional regulator [Kofleriaceae bacterium]|jgi:AraC-like DNA-binding protein|nr:AraC family transcriptional regulator [Kofleriaceae bacterium]
MRRAQPNLIQFPPAAPLGFPISVARLDGMGDPIHAEGPHAHGFFALLYATGGTGTMQFGRQSLRINNGSLVVTAPGEVHDTAGLRGVSRWGLDFMPDVFGAEAAGWLFPRPSRPEWIVFLRRSWDAPQVIEVPAAQREDWYRQFATISHELAERAHGYREIVRAELKTLLIRTARLVRRDLAPEPHEPLSPLLGEVFDVIEARFAERVSLTDVARAVGRSPAHLTTVVREQTGMTVQQWIIERRMAEARQRLMVSDENVNVLAERVGYRDPTLFIRHFKRAHGVTPRRWRNGS